MRVSFSLPPLVNLGSSIATPIKNGCQTTFNILKSIPQVARRSGVYVYKVINTNNYTRAAFVVSLGAAALLTIYILRKSKNAPEQRDSAPHEPQDAALQPSPPLSSVAALHPQTPPSAPAPASEPDLGENEEYNALRHKCLTEWKELSFLQIVIDRVHDLEKLLKIPASADLRTMLLDKSGGLPALTVFQLCPSLFKEYFLSSSRALGRHAPTFSQRFALQIKTYDDIERIVTIAPPEVNVSRFFGLSFLHKLAGEEVLNNLEYYLDNQVELFSKPQVVQDLFRGIARQHGQIEKETFGGYKVHEVIRWTSPREKIISQMRTGFRELIKFNTPLLGADHPPLSLQEDAELVKLFHTCREEWSSLSFDEIVTSRTEQLDRVLKAPRVDKALRALLLKKTKDMKATDLLKACPLLFRSGFFNFSTRAAYLEPTFRERFSRELWKYESVQELQKSYGEGFFELALLSPASLFTLATSYISRNPREYLLTNPSEKRMIDPGPIRLLADPYWNECMRLRMEYGIACRDPNVKIAELDDKLQKDIDGVVAEFTKELQPVAEQILDPES